MYNKFCRFISIMLLVTFFVLALSPTGVASAATPKAAPEKVYWQEAGPADPQEMEKFIDEFITAQLKEEHIPGATVSVVKDGALFFAKGYGFADLESQRPVIANRTLFGIGSTSKLFTWTAVMQLVEQGKLDLNADINIYLGDFQIPATYDRPITLAHLLTHTAGFEDIDERMFISEASSMTTLAEHVERYLPERIYAPGQVVAYSNYGTALAGYIVEELSGIPFIQYTQENIFNPLGMSRTTFQEPLPPELARDQAIGYQYLNGEYQPYTRYIQGFPAGSGWSTAEDMARFMIAHLQEGRYQDTRILQESTAREMHDQHYTQDPKGSGMGYGFMVIPINDQQTIGHAGGRVVYFTGFVLLPEHNVGLFVSYNGNNGDGAPDKFIQAFMDRYYPGPSLGLPQPKPDFADRAKRFLGNYRNSRHNESTYEKLSLVISNIPVKLSANNTLELGGHEWVESGDPLVFVREDGNEKLIFQEDGAGEIKGFMFQNLPVHFYFKAPWNDTALFTILWGSVGVIFFLATLIVWPLKGLLGRARHRKNSGNGDPPSARVARWLAWTFSALSLLFFVAFFIVFLSGVLTNEGQDSASSLFLIPPLNVVLVSVMVVLTALAWRRRYWSTNGRVYYTLLTLASILFLGWLNYFNLISFSF